jgi:hypothetical protein
MRLSSKGRFSQRMISPRDMSSKVVSYKGAKGPMIQEKTFRESSADAKLSLHLSAH